MLRLFELVGVITIDGLERAQKGIRGIEKDVNKALRPIARFGNQLASVGKQFTTSFTVPVGLAGAAILKFGADFEKSMVNSTAIMGDLSDEIRSDMADTAKDIVNYSSFSAKQGAESYFYLASAGLDAANSIAAIPRVTKFAQAGNFDLALATDLLTDAQSALGLTVSDTTQNMENMTHVSDVLVRANTLANATVQQFSESLTNRAGASLRLLNKDIEEGVAVLSVFASQGRKGEEAGTMLDIVLRDLQKSSIENRNAFIDAGIAVFDASGDMRNMADIMSDMEKRMLSMSDEQRRAELMTLGFTDKSIAATMALIGTSDAIREYESQLRKAGGTTDEVASKQMKSLTNQLIQAKNRLINVAITFSNTLIPIVKDQFIPIAENTIQKLTKMAEWFNRLSPSVKDTAIKLALFTAAVGPALVIIGKLISSVTLITTSIKTLRLAIVALNAVSIASPFVAAIAVVTTFALAIKGTVEAYKNLQKEHERFTVMTKDQSVRNELIKDYNSLIEKMKLYSEELKNEGSLDNLLKEDIDKLTEKARELGFVIEGNTGKRLEALNTIAMEVQGVRDATGALVKYTGVVATATSAVSELSETDKQAIREREEADQDTINALVKRRMDKVRSERQLEEDNQETINNLVHDNMFRRNKLEKEASDERRKLNTEEIRDKEQLWSKFERAREEAQNRIFSLSVNFLNSLNGLFSTVIDRRISRLEDYYSKEKEMIDQSELSEEEKAERQEQLDNKVAKQKRELIRKQAILNKLMGILSVNVNAGAAIMKAWADIGYPGAIPVSVLIGGVSTVESAMIAAQPIPNAEKGMFVEGTQDGTVVNVAEKGKSEMIFPLDRGIDLFVDRFMSKLSSVTSAMSKVSSKAFGYMNASGNILNLSLNIGNYYGDDRSKKELFRELEQFRFAEDGRIVRSAA